MRLFGKVDGSIDKNDRPFFMGGIFSRRFHHEFPTLSSGYVSCENFGEVVAKDPAILTEYEDGTISTRAGFTNLKDKFNKIWRYITTADRVLLKNLQTAIHVGVMPFFWTNPDDDVENDVRLDTPIKFRRESNHPGLWSAQFKMTEN